MSLGIHFSILLCQTNRQYRLVNRFRDTGSVQDRDRSGRPSVLSDDSLDDIRQTLLRSPLKSLRTLSHQSGLSYGHEATKILKLHYVVYELKEHN
jgi:transposase